MIWWTEPGGADNATGAEYNSAGGDAAIGTTEDGTTFSADGTGGNVTSSFTSRVATYTSGGSNGAHGTAGAVSSSSASASGSYEGGTAGQSSFSQRQGSNHITIDSGSSSALETGSSSSENGETIAWGGAHYVHSFTARTVGAGGGTTTTVSHGSTTSTAFTGTGTGTATTTATASGSTTTATTSTYSTDDSWTSTFAGIGPMGLQGSTTLSCERSLSVGTTTSVSTTCYSVSDGYPITVSTTVAWATTSEQTVESSYQTTTDLGGYGDGAYALTIVRAEPCHYLWVAGPQACDATAAASEWFTTAGGQTTLTPHLDVLENPGGSSTSESSESTVDTSTSISSEVSAGTRTRTGSTYFSGHTSSRNTYHDRIVAPEETGCAAEIYDPGVTIGWPTTSVSTITVDDVTYTTGVPAGPATVSVEGPATVSFTFVPPGTASATETVSSWTASGTHTFTVSAGIGIATTGCMALATNNAAGIDGGVWQVLERACYEGAGALAGC